MREYELLVRAAELRDVDTDYRLHEQAFLNFVVQGRNKNGRPVYRRFKQFFNYVQEVKEVMEKRKKEKKTDSRFARLSKHLKEKRGDG